jgi:TATA-binding protein-associated factor Taf7
MPKKSFADYKQKFDALEMSVEHHRHCLDTATSPEKKASFKLSILKNIKQKQLIRDRLKRLGFKQWNLQ